MESKRIESTHVRNPLVRTCSPQEPNRYESKRYENRGRPNRSPILSKSIPYIRNRTEIAKNESVPPCGSGGPKSSLAKCGGRARWEMKNCTPLWREAHVQVKMYKAHHSQTTFGSWDVQKLHSVVARSTFANQNVQNTSRSDHFWKFRCRKSARRCGAKHMSKSKVKRTEGFGPLFDVQMSKKCTPLWREV